MPKVTLTAIIHQEDDLYVAECPEVGTVSQGVTVQEAERISGEEAVRALERLRFRRGSHAALRKETPVGTFGCAVPLHRELAEGTLRGILRQAQVSPEEFIARL